MSGEKSVSNGRAAAERAQEKAKKGEKNLHENHRERVKRRFLQSGLDDFDSHNILELLLFFSIARKDTNETAHQLIREFGSFSGVCDAPYEELLKVPGIGENSAVLLKLLPGLCRRYLEDKCSHISVIDSTRLAGTYLLSKFVGVIQERIILMCLDAKCRLLSCTVVHEGSVNAAEVSIRSLIEQTVRTNASSVIIAHNHPGGVALPSPEDIETTKRIIEAMRMINVHVVDHIIVADDDYVSLADSARYTGLFE